MSSISLEQNSRHVPHPQTNQHPSAANPEQLKRDQSAQQLNRNACSSQDKMKRSASKRRNSNHSTASSSGNSASDAVKPEKQPAKASKNKERRQRARNDKKSSGHQKPENCKQPLGCDQVAEFTLDEKSSQQPKTTEGNGNNSAISDASTNLNDSDINSLEDAENSAKLPKRKFKNAAERIRFVRSYQKKLKTEMCKNWEMHGTCKWLDRCSFAHGAHELSKKKHLPRNFKSKICEQYHKTEIGFCAYGNRCQFLHSQYNILQQDVEQPFSYTIQLMENARISKQRFQQIELSDELIYVNLFSNEHHQQSKRLSAFENITSSISDDNVVVSNTADEE